ncbi:conserved hypothetical protein [Tenacibaculum amylolyticum]
MFKFLKITCQEANEICNKSQYNEATFTEKIKLNIHILFCKICAMYSKQNRKMTDIFNSKKLDCQNHVSCMSDREKELLKEKLKEMST